MLIKAETRGWYMASSFYFSNLFFIIFLKISHQGRDERVVHGRERVEQEHPKLVYPCADLSSQRLKHALALFFCMPVVGQNGRK
jgi:hypothetical protein